MQTITEQVVQRPTGLFNTIVVASDFREEADRALDYAKSIARRFDAELVAVHVTDPVSPISVPEAAWCYDLDPTTLDEEFSESLGETLRSEGFRARAICPQGRVAEEILRAAEDARADLVISGTHARRGTARWFYGSISEEIARKLKKPLFLVGPKAVPVTADPWQPKHLLGAVCMDKDGQDLAVYTARLAAALGARWELACDYTNHNPGCMDWKSFRSQVQELLAKGEDARAEELRSTFLKEPYSESLAEAAWVREADLVLIGHSKPLLHWSAVRSGTLPRLLAEAPCPVLAVPEKHP